MEITGWKAADGECDKCSGGGGGPIKIQGKCEPKKEHYSCKGVEVEMETKDCSKYCSGVGRLNPWFYSRDPLPCNLLTCAKTFLCHSDGTREMQFSGNARQKRGILVQKEIVNQAF